MRSGPWLLACAAAWLVCVPLAAHAEEDAERPGRLVVFHGEGQLFEGAQVLLADETFEALPVFRADAQVLATTDARGQVEGLDGGDPATGRLVVWAPDHAPALVPASPFTTAVRLLPAHSVSGSVRYAPGVPARQVEIFAIPAGTHGDLAHRVESGGDGRYHFSSLHEGRWRLFVRRGDGRAQLFGEVATGEARDVDIARGASVTGVALEAGATGRTGVASVGLALSPLRAGIDRGTGREARTDAAGAFVFSDLPPGMWQATVRDPRWEFDGPAPRIEVRPRGLQRMPAWFLVRRFDVVGTMQDERGRPLGGATVRLLRDAVPEDVSGAGSASVQARRTDPQGAFRLWGVSPGDGYRLLAVAPGYAPFVSEAFAVDRGRDTRLPPLRMTRGWQLEVRAQGVGGRPVGGLRVTVLPARHPESMDEEAWKTLVREGTTDAGGAAVLADLGPDPARLVVRGAGWVERTEPLVAPPGGRHLRLQVFMTRALALTGQVVPEDGRRGGPYRVRATRRNGQPPYETRTDADGRFTLDDVAPGTVDVEVLPADPARDVVLARRDHVDAASEPHVELIVPTLRILSGSVLDLEPGAGAAWVLLEAPRFDPVLARFRWETVARQRLGPPAGAEAPFELTSIPPGTYALRALQGGRDSDAVPVTVGEDDLERLELPLPAAASIAGTVLDAEDRPVTGARVELERLRGDGDAPTRPGGALVAYTDTRGAFVFEQIAAGVWRVRTQSDGAAPDEEDVRVNEGEALVVRDLVLDAGGSIRGRALDESGAPLDGARVTFRRIEAPLPVAFTRTRQDGSFEAWHLRPGAYVVRLASYAGRGPQPEALVQVTAGEVAEIDFAAAGRGSIEGSVLRRGKAVAGAELELLRTPTTADEPLRRYQTTSDAAGRFRWGSLLPGTYHVILGDRAAQLGYDVVLQEGDTVELELEAWDGRLAGSVEAVGGRAVPSARVTARPLDAEGRPGDEIVAQAFTGPRGAFVLSGLPVGWYRLEVRAAGHPPGVLAAAQADLPGADHPVVVVLGGGGELALLVRDSALRGVTGARVWLEDADGTALHARAYVTGPGGRLRVEGVRAGPVRVRVQARGLGRPPLYGVDVPEGGRASLEVLLPVAGRLRLVVTGDGRDPATRARIDIVRAGTSELVERRRPLTRLRLDPRWGYVPRTGVLEIDDLAPGEYVVVIDAGPTYPVTRQPVGIGPGATTVATVALISGPRDR